MARRDFEKNQDAPRTFPAPEVPAARLIEDGRTGLVVPVNNAHALAAALRRLAHDDGLCRRMGEAARVREHELPRALAAWEAVVGLCN